MNTLVADSAGSLACRPKEAVYLADTPYGLGFGTVFSSVPMSVTSDSTVSSKTKCIALRFFFLKELVKDGGITIHHNPKQNPSVDITTKHLSCNAPNNLINPIKTFAT